ncbi:MAG: glycosyl transferase family 28 [Alphaproteobacteria bacterium]|nr:glycosyl transferase family 28 [Alphaproteobacteria bacterium]
MPSVLFYVQYLLGIGHLQRSLRIADALAADGTVVTLVNGGFPAMLPHDPEVRVVQLPPVRARDARFELIDGDGRPLSDALREQRRVRLLALLDERRPDAVVTEGFPFARRAFRFELDPLIAAARSATPRPRIACSVRDIIVMRDDPERHREIVDRVLRDFDAVLVHGDERLIALDASFPAAPQIADRLVYTGYVSPAPGIAPPTDDIGADEVVVSAGGGIAGFALMQAAVAACRGGCLADVRWRLLAGTNLPEPQLAELRASAPGHMIVERFRDNLAGMLQRCRVSVSQGGYNTILDVLVAGARAVVVPYAAERETEQLLRAERLAARGRITLVREPELSGEMLAAAIDQAAAHNPEPLTIDVDGAARSARLIRALIAAPHRAARELAATVEAGMITR